MPVSPFRRAVEEIPKGSTAKKGNHQTSSRRNRKQKIKASYAKAREDAQLAGIIPTEPVGAVRNEVVDPRFQGCQQLPAVIREALRNNWKTPDEAKPAIIGSLLEPFFAQDVVLDKDGNQVKVAPNREMLIDLAKTLKLLDQTQFERDNPEAAGAAKGGGTAVSVQTNIAAVDLLNKMFEHDRIRGGEPTAALDVAGQAGHSGLNGKVEAGGALAVH